MSPSAGRSVPPVVVVDDHDLVADALVVALQQRSLRVRRVSVRSEAQVLGALDDKRRGVVLLDLDLGRDEHGDVVDGQRLIEPLRERGWRVVVVSGSREPSRIAATVAAGALGYVLKTRRLHELVRAAVEAVEGRQIMTETERSHWLEVHRRACVRQARRDERLDRLSPREREVLDLLARGQRVTTIAERFVVAEATVRTQVKSILRKLGVNSQIEAVALHRAARAR